MKIKSIIIGMIIAALFAGFMGAFYQQRHRLKGIAKAQYKQFFRIKGGEVPSDELVREDNEEALNLTITLDPQRKIGDVSPLLYGANLPPRTESEADIIEFIRNSGFVCFRFPGGGSMGYHWKEGTFDFSDRFTKTPLSDINYVIEFCKITGTRLIGQVNVESGTPEEAAGWVEYMNKKMNFPIVYWELGNEVYGNWDKGFMTGKKYAEVIKKFAVAMKKVDPNIKIGVNWAPETRWFFNVDVAKGAGHYVDFISVHWYPSITDPSSPHNGRIHPLPQEVMANYLHVPWIVKGIHNFYKKYAPHRSEPVEVCFLEWDGASDGPASDFPPYSKNIVQWSLANAIFYADTLGMFANTGVTVSATFDFQSIGFGLIKGWDKNAGWGGQRWDGETVRPKALAIELYAKHFGDVLIASKITGFPYYFRKKDWSPDTFGGQVPYVTAYASIFTKEAKVALVLINKHPTRDYKAKIYVLHADPNSEGKIYVLNGPTLMAQNDGAPGTVRIKENDVRGLGSEFDYVIPAHSVNLIEMSLASNEKQ